MSLGYKVKIVYYHGKIYYNNRSDLAGKIIWRQPRLAGSDRITIFKSNNIFTKPNNKLERESKMVSEMIRNRLLPLILDKLLDLEPGYTGSRISYRDSLRDSLDIDNLPEDYLNRSQETFIERFSRNHRTSDGPLCEYHWTACM